MTTETYDKKPKFDPNKPFVALEEKPKFDASKPFEPVEKKSKVGGVSPTVSSGIGEGGLVPLKKEGMPYIDIDGNKVIMQNGNLIGQGRPTDEEKRTLHKETREEFYAGKGLVPLDISSEQVKQFEENKRRFDNIGAGDVATLEEDPLKVVIEPYKKEAIKRYESFTKGVEKARSETTGQKYLSKVQQDKVNRNDAKVNQADELALGKFEKIKEQAVNELFPNGQVAKQALQNYATNKGIDISQVPNSNETIKAAKQKAIEYDMDAADIAATGDINNAAILAERRADPNFDAKVSQWEKEFHSNDYKTIIPEALYARVVDKFLSKGNAGLIAEQDPDLKAQYDHLKDGGILLENPTYGAAVVANEMSRKREEDGKNNAIGNFATQDYMDKLAATMYADNPAKKKIYDDIIRKDLRKYIDTPGFLDRAELAIKHGFSGTESTIRGLAGSESNAYGLYNEEQAANTQVSAEPKGLWHQISGTSGDFGGLIAYMGLSNKVLEGAGISKGAANLITTAHTFYGDELAQARSLFPDDPTKQKIRAALSTAAFMALNPFMKSAKGLQTKFFEKIKPEIDKALVDIESGVSREAARDTFIGKVKNTIDYLGGAAKNNLTAVGEMSGLTLLKQATDKVLGLNQQTYNQVHPNDEVVDVAKMTAMGLAPVSLLSAGGKRTAKNNLFEVASKPARFKNVFTTQELTNPDFWFNQNIKKEDIDFLGKTKVNLDEVGLPEKLQKSYILHSMNERLLQRKLESVDEPTLKKNISDQIKRSQEAKEKILKGENVDALPQEVNTDNLKDHEKHLKEMFQGDENGSFLKAADQKLLGGKTFDKDKVPEFLETVAMQSNNVMRGKDGEIVVDEKFDSRKSAEERWDKSIIDAANEMYPEYKKLGDTQGEFTTPIKDTSIPTETAAIPEGTAENVVPSTLKKEIVTPEGFTNRVFDSNPQLGQAPKDAHISEEGYNYRTLSKKEVDAIKESGGVFSREGKQKGGNANTKYWTKGNKKNWYGDKESSETIRVKDENFKEDKVVRAEDLEIYNKETKKFEPLIKEQKTSPTKGDVVPSTLKDGGAYVIMPGEIKKPEVTTISPKENVVEPKTKISVILPKNESKETTTILIEAKETKPIDAEPNKAGSETSEGTPPISEPPKGGGVFAERPATELSHRGLQDVANEFSLPDVQTRDTKTDVQLRQDARETVNDWAEKGQYGKNVEKLVVKAEDGEVLTDKERVILEGHLANVSQELREIKDKNSPEFDSKLAEIKRLKDAGEKTRSEAGAALRVPIGGSRPKDIADFMVEEMDSAGVEKLTEKQKETVAKEFEDLEKAKQEFEVYRAKKEQELSAKQAETEFTKTKTTAKKTNKTHDDFVSERKSLKDELAAAKKEHDDWLKEQGIQKSGFGSLTGKEAKVIAKIVKSYAEEGITKLAEVVEKVFEEVKGIIPNIEKRDIQDVIAGAYAEKKKTRNELAATLVNLRSEQKLVDKLEQLEKGVEPKSEKDKIKRNKELAELRKQVQEHDLTKLAKRKETIKEQIAKTEQQIKSGDFSQPEKKQPIKLDEEGNKLRDQLMKVQQQRDVRMLLQQRQNETKREKAFRLTAEVANIPRTLMTIADFSGLLRQNLFFSVGHPLMTSKALPGMFKSFTSKKVYDRWFADLQETNHYDGMKESRLAIADPLSHDLSIHEEAFMSSLAEKIPVIGESLKVDGKTVIPGTNIVKGSERSYTYLLNKVRVDMYNFFADSMEKRGLTVQNSPKEYKAMAEYINNATGRSDFGEKLNRIAPILNSVFFSPRLIASRVNMLTYWAQPRFWKTLPREVKIDYFRNWISLLAVGGTILALAKLGGADVKDDPRSSDFGKIKSGNTRWDIWGGAQPYVRVLSQVISGERKSTRSGKLYDLSGDDIFGETRAGVTADFFRNKLAPIPGAAVDLLSGRTGIGEKIMYQWGDTKDKEIAINHYIKERLLPMTFTGTAEAMKDQGVKALFTVGIPNIFGVGTQTYDSTPAPAASSTKKQTKQSGRTNQRKQTKATQ